MGTSTASKTLLSVRVQVQGKRWPAPTVVLLRPGASGQDETLMPVTCELLKESFAESYFALARASVLLIAELAPGEQCALEVAAQQMIVLRGSQEKAVAPVAPSVASDAAISDHEQEVVEVVVTHDGPLAVEVEGNIAAGGTTSGG